LHPFRVNLIKNLQNIPAKDEIGKEIRKAFIPEKGNVLLVADYNQIELRLLAHISRDPGMLKIYKEGRDIHQETADAVFPEMKDRKQARYNAKKINFSINYGISYKSLAKELKVTTEEAKQYVWKYLNKYPQVAAYMKEIVEETKELGYSTTMFGRKRPVPDLQSDDKRFYEFGKRVAMNNPIQGSAADIVKIAMIQVFRALKFHRLKTRLLLQVHDELIFEVPKEEVHKAKGIIMACMEYLDEYLKTPLTVPMVASIGAGKNWTEAKE
jgi:DNA polymerase-1